MSAPDLSKFLKPNHQGVRELEFRALGTECHIKIRLKSERDALQFAADTLEWIKNFEEKYSNSRKNPRNSAAFSKLDSSVSLSLQ